jgi:hypothetical protein
MTVLMGAHRRSRGFLGGYATCSAFACETPALIREVQVAPTAGPRSTAGMYRDAARWNTCGIADK